MPIPPTSEKLTYAQWEKKLEAAKADGSYSQVNAEFERAVREGRIAKEPGATEPAPPRDQAGGRTYEEWEAELNRATSSAERRQVWADFEAAVLSGK